MNMKLSKIGKEGKGEKEEEREPRTFPPLIGTQYMFIVPEVEVKRK